MGGVCVCHCISTCIGIDVVLSNSYDVHSKYCSVYYDYDDYCENVFAKDFPKLIASFINHSEKKGFSLTPCNVEYKFVLSAMCMYKGFEHVFLLLTVKCLFYLLQKTYKQKIQPVFKWHLRRFV